MTSIKSTSAESLQLEDELILTLSRLSMIYRAHQIREGTAMGLSPIQIELLVYLDQHHKENITLSRLAIEFVTTKASLSDSIQNLLTKELLIKKAVKQDRRSQAILLTQQGKKLAARIRKNTASLIEPLHDLPYTDKRKLVTLLLRILYPAKARLSGTLHTQL